MEFVWAQTGNGRFLAYYGKIILMPEILMGSNSCTATVVRQALQIMKFRESGDQDNDHHIFMNHDHFMIILAQATPWTLYAIYTVSRLYIWRLKYFALEVSIQK